MTPGERSLWLAVYAASWHVSTGRPHLGHFTDEDRARWCAQQASKALEALRRAVSSDSTGELDARAMREVLE